ncbi:tetratricopeptide repeat-containing diguanylate cyclase [Solimicrobium silvestre]|uniref:diguanylate cyclase n=1 Tax=Solimicrobium silvestre TaxID=2099400 RepID=A0A2S9H0N4_9BURK|nr:diguanylate cyclase [Solimicrobium silvestre]PRC93513.1 GGDEF: diguanylate cyclase (GGDEF) domain [Solimicrobium silvestre]
MLIIAIHIRNLLPHWMLTIVFCCSAMLSVLAYAKPTPTQTEITRLQKLGESQPEQAIKQLQTLQQQLPIDAIQTDRRNLLLVQIPLYIDTGNKEQAKALIAGLMKIGNQFDDPVANIMAMNFQAKILQDEGKYGEGLAVIEQTFVSVKLSDDNLLINQVESRAGELYSLIGNFQTALQHQLSALNALDSIKENSWQSDLLRAKTLNSVGRLYLSLKDDDMALSYLAKARVLAQRLDAPALVASIANNNGYAYADLEQWTSAIAAYQESLFIARKVDNRAAEAKSLGNLADASLNQGNYSACVQYSQQSMDIAHKDGITITEGIAHLNLGVCRMYMGQVAKGVAEAKLGVDFVRKTNAKPVLEGMLSDLSKAYEKVGLYQDSLKILREKDQITSGLFQAARDRTIIEMKVHYDLTQRQKEIEKLEQKNTLQHVEIENKNLQRIISILTIIGIAATAIGLFLLYRKVRRSNQRLRAANLKLKYQSTRDPLTGLLNRRAFQNVMESFDQKTERRVADMNGLHDVLVLLDIDHFKYVNDTYGHPIGDVVLIELSKRLQNILREKDMLMRWGGEEFLIYLYRVPAEKVSQIIQRELAVVGGTPVKQNDVDDAIVPVTISAGYILMPLPGIGETALSWEKAMQLVDVALYMAKTNGRNQAIGVTSVKGSKEQINALIEGDLQGAVENGTVVLQRIAGPATEQKM